MYQIRIEFAEILSRSTHVTLLPEDRGTSVFTLSVKQYVCRSVTFLLHHIIYGPYMAWWWKRTTERRPELGLEEGLEKNMVPMLQLFYQTILIYINKISSSYSFSIFSLFFCSYQEMPYRNLNDGWILMFKVS